MKYGDAFKIDNIMSGLQKELKQGVRAVKKSAIVVKDKTGEITREGVRQLTALEKKSKEALKKAFRKVA
ncbi:MAG TPA: hypothetical protein VFK23_01715 [Nitrospirota bacterium]|nr:hypothetical protein [Nitrospirota bacterium]